MVASTRVRCLSGVNIAAVLIRLASAVLRLSLAFPRISALVSRDSAGRGLISFFGGAAVAWEAAWGAIDRKISVVRARGAKVKSRKKCVFMVMDVIFAMARALW